jgi:AraC-like DNA-binding protein
MPEGKRVRVRPHVVAFSRSPALPGVEFVSTEYRGPLAPTAVEHRYLFIRTMAGDGDVVYGGKVVRLCAGVLMALQPGDVVKPERRRSEETRHRVMMMEPSVLAGFLASAYPDREPPQLQRGALGPAASSAFDALFEAAMSQQPALDQQCKLTAFLEAAMADPAEQLPVARLTPPVAQARKILEERFDEDVRLEELEARVGLSRFYLVRRFRAEVGMPPHAFQLALRLDRAKVLTAQGVPLADVALRCGFTDQSHLSRHFRKLVGVAPGAYARSAGVRRG